MTRRDAFSGSFLTRTVCLQALVACVVLFSWSAVRAQINVTETFDVGVGTRFNLFVDNVVLRPKPGTLVPAENPDDTELIDDAFGGQRMFVENGNILTNHFGLTNTQNAGGAGAGEFGGEFNWFNEGGVADTTLGGVLNHSNEVVIRAKMRLDDIGFDNDQRAVLGYFNLPDTPVGADFDRGKISAGIAFVGGARFLLQINGNNSGAIGIPGGYDEDTGFTNPFDVDLTLKFDSGLGQAWFEGNVAGIPINQFTFSQAADADHPFDSFAITQSYLREAQDAFRRGVVWIDDLTYSVVSDLGIDNPNPTRIGPDPSAGNGGDYNGDGTVNAADYAVWRDNLGASGTPGSVFGDGTSDDLLGTPDGDVDQFDYGFWMSRFGTEVMGSGSSSVTAVVPEPAMATLLLAVMLFLPALIRFRS
ncbi:MAG: hypothetical protein WD851_04585 [Pirellulales bacterium]